MDKVKIELTPYECVVISAALQHMILEKERQSIPFVPLSVASNSLFDEMAMKITHEQITEINQQIYIDQLLGNLPQ